MFSVYSTQARLKLANFSTLQLAHTLVALARLDCRDIDIGSDGLDDSGGKIDKAIANPKLDRHSREGDKAHSAERENVTDFISEVGGAVGERGEEASGIQEGGAPGGEKGSQGGRERRRHRRDFLACWLDRAHVKMEQGPAFRNPAGCASVIWALACLDRHDEALLADLLEYARARYAGEGGRRLSTKYRSHSGDLSSIGALPVLQGHICLANQFVCVTVSD